MSLYKVPFALLFTAAVHISATSPNPPPPKYHGAVFGKIEFLAHTNAVPALFKYVCWLNFAIEAVIIIANNTPSSAISTYILNLADQMGGDPNGIRPTIFTVFATLVTICGWAFRVSSFQALGRFFTFERTIQKDHKLITNGPYSIMRHPGYLGVFLLHIGAFCWYGSQGSLLREFAIWNSNVGKGVISTVTLLFSGALLVVIKRMPIEDQTLHKKFGREWEEWAQKVPYSVIPGVF